MRTLPLKNKSAYLITDRLTRKYLSSVDISEGFFLVSKTPVYFTDARYFYAAKQTLEKVGIIAKLYKGLDDIKVELKSQGVKKLYLDYDRVTLTEYDSYKALGVKLLNGSFNLSLARSVKDQDELNCIKRACEITEKALATAFSTVCLGMTELQLKETIESEMFSLGAEEIAFDTIVAFGPNSAVPHHQTGETVLTDNTVILVDTGCKINGYCSDITRTIFFGEPSKKFTDCYSAVLNANLKAEQLIVAGDRCNECDGYARSVLQEQGLGEYFTHSLGHGVGLEIHEYPTLSPKRKDALLDGMVFTVEPGVYFDNEFGIRIEDTVVLSNGKIERLFTDSKELIIKK